jgi:predicted phage terminase large subunit-like protein
MNQSALQSGLLAAARDYLAVYHSGVWPGLVPARHLEILIGELEAVERGEVKRLAVAMPPGHAKSTVGTLSFPSWFLGRHPNRQVISVSHTAELATDFGRKVLGLVGSDLFRAAFPAFQLAGDAGSASRFTTRKGGAYYAVGLGGAITGRRANLIVIDDPFKDRADAMSPAIRKAVKEAYTSTIYPRLMPQGAIVLISTRWHEDDLIGWLTREHRDDDWRLISMPAIAESDEGWRRPGEALWPEAFPIPELERMRRAIGEAAWVSLYQQRPAAAEGAVFKRDWWRTYLEPPAAFERVVFSADTAFSAAETADYSVITVWGETKTAFYLLHLLRSRLEFPELKRALAGLASQWRPNTVLVENRASGQSLIQELQRETSFPVLAVDVSKDKITRANAVTPMVEAGRVYVPESAPWVGSYLDELSSFPAAQHDDQVDSTTMALDYLGRRTSEFDLAEYARLVQEDVKEDRTGWKHTVTPGGESWLKTIAPKTL